MFLNRKKIIIANNFVNTFQSPVVDHLWLVEIFETFFIWQQSYCDWDVCSSLEKVRPLNRFRYLYAIYLSICKCINFTNHLVQPRVITMVICYRNNNNRVWDVKTGKAINTLMHHCEPVLHLRFDNGLMVTCSKVCGLIYCIVWG